MVWIIYALVATAVAVAAITKAVKWKIATRTLTLFCKEKFREPTNEELADCAKRAVTKTMK